MGSDVDRSKRTAWLMRSRPIGAVLAIALLLTGCGGGSSSGDPPAAMGNQGQETDRYPHAPSSNGLRGIWNGVPQV